MEKKQTQEADIFRIDASWMKLLGMVLQEGMSPRTVDAVRETEAIRLQAGLPALEELAGRHSLCVH